MVRFKVSVPWILPKDGFTIIFSRISCTSKQGNSAKIASNDPVQHCSMISPNSFVNLSKNSTLNIQPKDLAQGFRFWILFMLRTYSLGPQFAELYHVATLQKIGCKLVCSRPAQSAPVRLEGF